MEDTIASQSYSARKATEADIPVLKEITNRDESRRLNPSGHSYHPQNCMMVVEEDGRVIGSVFLLFARPLGWPDAEDTSLLPQVMSLVVRGECRNRGAGTFLIGALEEEVKSRGLARLYIAFGEDNTGAQRLYKRLGYKPISDKLRRISWTYKDENGVEHEEEEWVIDMVKTLE